MIKLNSLRILDLAQQSKKIRFLIAGGVNTMIGLSVYPILYSLLVPMGLGYLVVLFISQLICITFSFASNKYFVFKTQGNLHAEYTKFFVFHASYFLLNLICLPALVEVLEMNPIIAQTLFSVFIIVTSYFWHNLVTFKPNYKGSK
jgi:putative flippase GtrA